MTSRWTLTYPGRPWTLNMERKWSRHSRAQLVKMWRGAFRRLADDHSLPRPIPTPVNITAYVDLTMGYVMDAGNYYPAVKAAVDGLVDAGVLTADTPTWVRSYSLHAPVNRQEQDSLTLIIELEP